MVYQFIYHQKMSLVLWVLNEDSKECFKKKKKKEFLKALPYFSPKASYAFLSIPENYDNI